MSCRCCRRRRDVNARGLCDACAVCLHCERRPAVTDLGLCPRCDGEPSVRELYRRGHHWTPAWEMHLRRKTRQIQRELRRQRRRHPLEIDAPEG